MAKTPCKHKNRANFFEQLLADSSLPIADQHSVLELSAAPRPRQTGEPMAAITGEARFEEDKDPLASSVWRMYTKAKDALPDSSRVENLTWRMMALTLARTRDAKSREKATAVEAEQNNVRAKCASECMDIDSGSSEDDIDDISCEGSNQKNSANATPPKADDTIELLSSSAPPWTMIGLSKQHPPYTQEQWLAAHLNSSQNKNNAMIAGSTRAFIVSENNLPILTPAKRRFDDSYIPQQHTNRSITIPLLTEDVEDMSLFNRNSQGQELLDHSMSAVDTYSSPINYTTQTEIANGSRSFESKTESDAYTSLFIRHQSSPQILQPPLTSMTLSDYRTLLQTDIALPTTPLSTPDSKATTTDSQLFQQTVDSDPNNASNLMNNLEELSFLYQHNQMKASCSNAFKGPYKTNDSFFPEISDSTLQNVMSSTRATIPCSKTAYPASAESNRSEEDNSTNTCRKRNTQSSISNEQLPKSTIRTQCSNCQTMTTPLWRRDPQGRALCNACGLFLKLHGSVRPLSLKTDTIKKRNRTGNANNRTVEEWDNKLSCVNGNGKATEDHTDQNITSILLSPVHEQQQLSTHQKGAGRLAMGRHISNTTKRRSYQRQTLSKILPSQEHHREGINLLQPIAMGTQPLNSLGAKYLVGETSINREAGTSSTAYHSNPSVSHPSDPSSSNETFQQNNVNNNITPTIPMSSRGTSLVEQNDASASIGGPSCRGSNMQINIGADSMNNATARDAAIDAILKSVGIHLDALPQELMPLLATAATSRAGVKSSNTEER